MSSIEFDEREASQLVSAMRLQNSLIDELMTENKAYKKENERLKKYQDMYLEHRKRKDSGC